MQSEKATLIQELAKNCKTVEDGIPFTPYYWYSQCEWHWPLFKQKNTKGRLKLDSAKPLDQER